MYRTVIGMMAVLLFVVGSANAWSIASDDNGTDSGSDSGTGYCWDKHRNTSEAKAYAKTWDATFSMETCDTTVNSGVQWVKKYVTGTPAPCQNETVHYVATAQVWGKVTGAASNGGLGSGNCATNGTSEAIVNAPGYDHTLTLQIDGEAHESGGWSVGVTITGAGGSISWSDTGDSYNKDRAATLDKEDNVSAINAFVKLTMADHAHSWFDNGADGPHEANTLTTKSSLDLQSN